MSVPALTAAVCFAVIATVEWRRVPLLARVEVAVAAALALGAVWHPALGLTFGDGDGIAALVSAAEIAGIASLLLSAGSVIWRAALR